MTSKKEKCERLKDRWFNAWAKKQTLEKEYLSRKEELERAIMELADIEKARVIIHDTAEATRKTLTIALTDLATKGLRDVFDEDVSLILNIGVRGKKTVTQEVSFQIQMANGGFIEPMEDEGGGLLDIASLVLRVTLLALTRPKKRNVLLLDEPLKCLSDEYRQKGAALLKRLSQDLGIQIIAVNHKNEYNKIADNVIRLGKDYGQEEPSSS